MMIKSKPLIFGILIAIVGIIFISGYFKQPSHQKPEDKIEVVDSEIKTFVNAINFPKLQGISVILNVPEENLKVFQVIYGEPHDCPSGCFYSRATGIKHNNKIGWILINNYEKNFDTSKLKLYDFDPNETYLFSDDFFIKLKSKDEWVYRYAFLPLLSKDPDTPEDTLLKIAKGLSSYIQPSLANALLENPKVQTNKQILTIIANLPVYSGDAYKEVRSKAQNMLNNLK